MPSGLLICFLTGLLSIILGIFGVEDKGGNITFLGLKNTSKPLGLYELSGVINSLTRLELIALGVLQSI